MREIIIIIGLPGSGKTTLAEHINDGSYYLFDDMSINFFNIEKAKEHNKIIITDPALCVYDKQFIEHKMTDFFGKSDMEWIAFENNPELAIYNSKQRNEKLVHASYIKHLSSRYNPEQFDTVYPVYDMRNQ